MSLQLAAQHLARQGRGPDTELVHMGRGEVNALQEIARKHGGSLTINPETGLAEAGFLSRILPTVAGVGLSMIPGVGPLMAAGLVGGGVGLAKGSLKKGLMAGLGAYGGASLAASLGAAGSAGTGAAGIAPDNIGAGVETLPGVQATGNATTYAVPSSQAASGVGGVGEVFQPQAGLAQAPAFNATNAPTITSLTNPTAPAFNSVTSPNAYNLATPPEAMPSFDVASVAPRAVPQVAPTVAASAPVAPAAPALSPDAAKAAQQAANEKAFEGLGSASDRAAAMGRGLSGENLMNFAKQNPLRTAGMVASWMPGEKKPKEIEEDNSMPEYSFNQGMDNSVFSSPDYQANLDSGKQMRYFKNRGFTQTAAAGGVMRGLNSASSNLGSYSDGGRLLRGPGDGVSDSIPAVIGKRQPARLADGEFVIPARIVSELGNGSTEAGARKLYAMMDRIQKARKKSTGKKKVAYNSRSEKYLPA